MQRTPATLGAHMTEQSVARATLVALTALLVAPSVSAQSRMSKIDERAVWSEPKGVDTSRCDNPDNVFSRQLACMLAMMRQARASPEALAFARWYASTRKDIGYVSRLKPYGPVSLATVELPLRRNTNAHSDSAFEILNGIPNPVHGNTGCTDSDAVLRTAKDFQQLQRGHPDITTWEGTEFVSATALPGGVQRFVFSCPLGEYHAAAGQWFAFFALDFDARGKFLGHRLVKIAPGGQ